MSEKYQVAVIGSGSGGSEAALLAAEKGFQVIIIEKDAFGGTRFHRGCYAVRALHASSRLFREIVKSRRFGIETDLLRSSFLDWSKAQRAASARLAEELRKGLVSPYLRWCKKVTFEDAHRNWQIDGHTGEILCETLKVNPRRGRGGIGQPVQGNVIQHVIDRDGLRWIALVVAPCLKLLVYPHRLPNR